VAITTSDKPSALAAINVTPRRRMPMLYGSIGRIVASYAPMDRSFLEAEFKRAGWKSLSIERFLEQAAKARIAGYAVECGDVTESIHAVAAPVLAADGSLDRIVSIYALAADLPESRIGGAGRALADLANAISGSSGQI